MMQFRLAAAFMLGLGLAASFTTPAAALDLDALNDAERDALRGEIRAYLLDNPEVLMEAIQVLEQREAQAQVAGDVALVKANADALFADGRSWVGGNLDGDVTLVEFHDYRCSYCRQAHAEVQELVETDGNIRLILKEFPILGEQSVLASQFAIAVLQLHGDDAHKQVHDALMEMRAEISRDTLARLATALALDPAPILERMDTPEVGSVIAENRALAQRMQISGTPTFVLQDQMLRGYVPRAQMEQIVAAMRSE